MASKSLDDLFLDTLKDIYFAEKQILKALSKMARAAQDPKLRTAFEDHRAETEGHVDRLEKVFEIIDVAPRGKTCDAILGIIDEGKDIMEEFKETTALDAGLISSAQAVEHYEMARYGTLRAWAEELGRTDVAELMAETYAEEKATDEKLSSLAMGTTNAKAA